MAGKTQIIILAAGHGTRMKSDLPKVLIPFQGKPLITHVLDSVKDSGVCDKPTVVVGAQSELVMKTLGDDYQYAIQKEQLGTGHAVMAAQELLENKSDHVMVLVADAPFLSSKTIKELSEKHTESGGKITIATTKIPDFEDWRKAFINFGRILRQDKEIVAIREYRDGTEKEKVVKELNPGYYIFEAKWLWENLKTLNNDNDQKQYYLTDLVKIAIENKIKIESIEINPTEALAANSKEELTILEKLKALFT